MCVRVVVCVCVCARVLVCAHTVLSLCDTMPFASVFDVPLVINVHPFKDKCETEIGVVYLLN